MTRAANWRRWVTLGVAVVPLAASASLDARRHQSATPAAAAKAPTLTSITPRQRGHWGRYRVDREGRGIDVYAAHDSQPKPLVIFIHGSGCAPLVTVDTDGTFRDTTLFQDVVAQRLATAHFAMIDKRGVEPLRFSADMSQQDKERAFERTSRQCSAEYLQHVTKQERVDDVLATMAALAGQAWVQQIILAGHSEGTPSRPVC